jgi:hypothetical protein
MVEEQEVTLDQGIEMIDKNYVSKVITYLQTQEF